MTDEQWEIVNELRMLALGHGGITCAKAANEIERLEQELVTRQEQEMKARQTTKPDYVDKKYRENPVSVLYVENGLFIATKVVTGFGSSPDEAVRNLENGLSTRGFMIKNQN